MYKRSIKLVDAEGMKLAESVYVTMGSGENMLAARKGIVLDRNLITMLGRRDVKMVEIESDTEPEDQEPILNVRPRANVPDLVHEFTPEKPKPLPEKYVPIESVLGEKLKEEAVDSVKQLFNCFTVADGTVNKTTAYQCVSNIEGVVDDLLGVISSDSTGLIHINDLKHFDEYTYHHSLSVAMLSMATGRELGLDSRTLFRLGRCAMLHDVGKQMIPLEIINKKGRLTDDEYAKVQNHSVLGANSLKINALGDVELWNGIMFHHERMNGSGYPKQLKGKDIPLFSKIIAVADVYDAVTSYRSYRLPMLPSEAFEIIRKDIGASFEYDVVKAFFAKLELYPVNTIVELSDGRLGMVVESENAFRLRPAIRLWGSEEIIYLAAPTNQNLEIAGVMNPADLPNGYEFV